MDKVDPFTLRMLERARLRQEKLESKLQSTDKTGRSNKQPLKESNNLPVSDQVLSPVKKEVSPQRSPTVKDNQENTINSTLNRKVRANFTGDSELAVEINIVHQNNFQVDVQVEEREVSLVEYLKEKEEKKMSSQTGSSTSFHSLSSEDVEPATSTSGGSAKPKSPNVTESDSRVRDHSNTRAEISEDGKSRLKRLGQFYSGDSNLSSPVKYRKEITSFITDYKNEAVSSTTSSNEKDDGRTKNKRGNKRFADLASHINSMEDDLRHVSYRPTEKLTKKTYTTDSSSEVSSSAKTTQSTSRVTRRSVGKTTGKASPKPMETKSCSIVATIKSPRKSLSKDSMSSKVSVSRSPRPSSVGTKSPLLSARQSPRQSLVKDANLAPVRRSPRHSLAKDSTNAPPAKSTRQSIVALTVSDGKSSPVTRIQEARKMFQAGGGDKKQAGIAPSKSPLKWDRKIIQDLAQGDKSTPVSNMAAVAVTSPPRSPRITPKRPSIKKHKAPLPPKNTVENGDNEKENSSSDNFVSSVEDLLNGKSENDSGNDASSQKESTYSTADITRSQQSLNSDSSSNRSSPITRHRRMADNSNGSPGGNVMSKAAIFETTKFDSPRGTDPALMSLRERKALFEKNKGQVPIPKAAFGMAPPLKALQGNGDKGGQVKKPVSSIQIKPKIEPKPEVAPIHSATARLGNLGYKMAHVLQPSLGEKSILDRVAKEREEEMIMLKNRFNRAKMLNTDLDSIETEIDHDQTSEDSPLMGSGDSRMAQVTASSLSINKKGFNKETSDDEGTVEADGIIGMQPTKRRSSTDSPQVVSALEDVKRIKVTKPKDGKLYPCLSDIEQPTTEDEKQSCLASSTNSLDSEVYEPVDDEQNWGDTSFGRELLNVVGVKKPVENKLKVRDIIKATRKSREKVVTETRDDSDASSNDCNSELDELLDEIMDDDSEGPTPPKQNKNIVSTQASSSFSYKKGSEVDPHKEEETFRSPLKTPPRSAYDEALSSGKPLVHTVSFYRKIQQTMGSQNSTPVRVVRREGDVDSSRKAEEEEERKKAERIAARDTKLRVKELLEEVAKQNTIISQASQALNLCASTIEFSGSTEQSEGERLLLLATHRRQACLHEVQRLQIEGLPTHTPQLLTLRMEELSVPLKREYVRQLNADGALGHYFMCLIKCQERVMATSLVKSTPDLFAIKFADKIRLEGMDPNFKITVEVYALQASKEFLPHNIKYHISNKKGGKLATPRKGGKGADLRNPLPITSPGGPSAVRTPALQPHGYCIFGYSQIAGNSFSLNKVSGPVEGSLKINLAIEKRVVSIPNRPPKKGFLTMFEEAGGFGAWHRRWCVLKGLDLSYWRYPDHEGVKTPMGTIELSTVVSEKVIPASRELCARPFTMFMQTSTGEREEGRTSKTTRRSTLCLQDGGVNTHLLAADTKEERDEWMNAFNNVLVDVRAMME